MMMMVMRMMTSAAAAAAAAAAVIDRGLIEASKVLNLARQILERKVNQCTIE